MLKYIFAVRLFNHLVTYPFTEKI